MFLFICGSPEEQGSAHFQQQVFFPGVRIDASDTNRREFPSLASSAELCCSRTWPAGGERSLPLLLRKLPHRKINVSNTTWLLNGRAEEAAVTRHVPPGHDFAQIQPQQWGEGNQVSQDNSNKTYVAMTTWRKCPSDHYKMSVNWESYKHNP